GDRSDPTVVLVAATVEHDRVDALGVRTLGDELAVLAGLGALVADERTQVRLERRGRRERLADRVVHDLGRDVARGARHHEARTSGAPLDRVAQAQVAARTRDALALAENLHSRRYLPAFPTLRRTTS